MTIRANRTLEDRARFGVGSDTQDDDTDPADTETPLTAEGVVESGGITLGATTAAGISADSTTLVGTGTDVQAVLEELDNAVAAGETVLVCTTDQNLATTTEENLTFALFAAVAGVYEFELTVLDKGSGAGQGVYIGLDIPADATYVIRGTGSTTDSAQQYLTAAGTGDLAATSGPSNATGASTWGTIVIKGRIVITTPGNVQFRVYTDHADPVVKAGSVLKYKLAA